MAMLEQLPPPPPHQGSSTSGSRLKRSSNSSSSQQSGGNSAARSPKSSPLAQTASGKMHFATLQAPQCPVVHHAPSQPLPPGHPPTHSAPASSLKPPFAERCVFYRTPEDLASTPPISRSGSDTDLIKSARNGQLVSHAEYLKEHANVRPLRQGESLELDPQHSLVLASRNSQLALIQSSHVHSMLEARYGRSSPLFHAASTSSSKGVHSEEALKVLSQNISALELQQPCHFPITSMSTAGDQNQRSPLYVIGGEGKAIWTKELEVALKAGAVDAIVHCLKDVPTTLPDGLEIAAILEREDPRDALVMKDGLPYRTLDELPPGSVIGTSSVRRVAQLRSRYPKLVFSDVRGNINTRLAKLDSPTGPYTALILAAAGLHRLSFETRITAYLCPPVLYYSVGQGSLAIEVRSPPPGATSANNRDKRIAQIIATIGCWKSTWRCEAERALLRTLEGGCSIPVGVDTWIGDETEEQRRMATTRIAKKEKSSSADDEDDLLVEGHRMNELAVPATTNESSRSGIERLETSAKEAADAEARGTDPADSAPSDLPRLPTTESVSLDDLATPPPSTTGARLHLSANVVSLDGTRRSHAYLCAVCRSSADAARLGEQVAQVLIDDQGARAILDEVERHRALAEAADQRRRAARAERLRQIDADAATAPLAVADGGSALRNNPVGEEQHKLMHVIGLSDLKGSGSERQNGNGPHPTLLPPLINGNGGLGYGEGIASGEVDRRGVQRDDGQPKAWEV
ncbi:hypothetical protein K437DRAFT_186560 [Tilletiaria anomala UBC 951]|uniref:hydroxymethylbilane synthase n=1 Tax=Tilletiaria anomala (strain ATCC 24038 / CBS 436.72 / UBC 951) TaxID=1037660 RepID=A0A066WFH3_TILAU|nr:uncharacterized protein K437DRAFT_186560 [Tilletiaria anomala UBC 951]KDN52536.1 hypothetical protein K437DRAFT_186560 [Tilletiaria anomala UBC 951]